MDNSRTEKLLGESAVEKLITKNVIVVGLGGVGGIVAEMLVRSGVGNITIMDFDKISASNVNRQVIATEFNIGKSKAEELKLRLKSINSSCNVTAIDERLTLDNLNLLNGFDYIIDAIDSVNDKTAMIVYAKTNNLPIISAMGAGNRICSPNYQITDIFKTQNDGLSKVIRKKLRENQITSHKVCYSCQDVVKCEGLGSVVWHPTALACVLVSEVINDLIKE